MLTYTNGKKLNFIFSEVLILTNFTEKDHIINNFYFIFDLKTIGKNIKYNILKCEF